MTISRRKMFGFLAAAPVMGAAVVEAVKAAPVEAHALSVSEIPSHAHGMTLFAEGDTVYQGVICRDLEQFGDEVFRQWSQRTQYTPEEISILRARGQPFLGRASNG